MKRIAQFFFVLLLAVLCLSPGGPARAGTNIFPAQPSVATLISVTNTVAPVTYSSVWVNPSYTGHQLYYTASVSNGNTFQVFLDGSFDNATWITVASANNTGGAGSVLTGSGFYPYIRAHFAISGGFGSCTAIYAGSPTGVSTNVSGTLNVQGFVKMVPLTVSDQLDLQPVDGAPAATVSVTANDSCDVGQGTATGTGCALVAGTGSFINEEAIRVSCNVSVSYRTSSGSAGTALSSDTPLPANTPEKFLLMDLLPHVAFYPSASGICTLTQLQSLQF